ncbi:SecY/SEC61-alpha family [Parasponia andersonii]|uniref:SecY/SEC61-alpha family n=1 Tax=Parasponia andersonii TaxID=3476 RepID=A0A2P5C2L3_PARAD|nr:SecY/SEC61-alpha family [Parasponia andersonii]
MEATLLSSTRSLPQLIPRKPTNIRGSDLQWYCPPSTRSYPAISRNPLESSRRHFVFLDRPFLSIANKQFFANSSNQFRRDCMNVDGTSTQSLNVEAISPRQNDYANVLVSNEINDFENLPSRPKMFRNRFLNFVRLSSVLNNAAGSFFKSEIRRRLFVTALLIVISRVGYFIPLPGFDRRLIPQDYLSFSSGSADELGDFTGELKLSLFQLGVGPQIMASIIMQMVDVSWICNSGSSDSFLLFTSIFNLRSYSKSPTCDRDYPFIGLWCDDNNVDLSRFESNNLCGNIDWLHRNAIQYVVSALRHVT